MQIKGLTLSANKDERDFLGVPVLSHLGIVTVHSLEADLVLQAEHKYHRIHPVRELKQNRVEAVKTMSVYGPNWDQLFQNSP